jgi:hypothetical protein
MINMSTHDFELSAFESVCDDGACPSCRNPTIVYSKTPSQAPAPCTCKRIQNEWSIIGYYNIVAAKDLVLAKQTQDTIRLGKLLQTNARFSLCKAGYEDLIDAINRLAKLRPHRECTSFAETSRSVLDQIPATLTPIHPSYTGDGDCLSHLRDPEIKSIASQITNHAASRSCRSYLSIMQQGTGIPSIRPNRLMRHAVETGDFDPAIFCPPQSAFAVTGYCDATRALADMARGTGPTDLLHLLTTS